MSIATFRGPAGVHQDVPTGYLARAIGSRPAPAAVRSSAAAASVESRRDEQDDQLCDVVSTMELAQKISEVLIDMAPSITGAQIFEIRRSLLAYGAGHGWMED